MGRGQCVFAGRGRGGAVAAGQWGLRSRMIQLTRETIDYEVLTEQVRRPGCGAVVTFLGTVRDLTEGQETVALDYEAYPGMAEKKMAEIERETRERWPVGDMMMV